MATQPRIRKKSAALAVAALTSGAVLLGGATPAFAADNVIADPALQACINEKALSRDPATPVTAAEVLQLNTGLYCTAEGHRGITTLEGLQGAPIYDLRFDFAVMPDLSPIGELPNLTKLTIQSPGMTGSSLDLSPMIGAADTLTKLSLTTVGSAPGAYDETMTELLGIDSFSNLTHLVVNASGTERIPGLAALTKLQDVRIASNYLANDQIAQLSGIPMTNFFMRWNTSNDFSWLAPGTKASIDGQRYLSPEPVLKSADSNTVIADPADRSRGRGGVPGLKEDGSTDSGALTMTTFVAPAILVQEAFVKTPVTAAYTQYTGYGWNIADSATSSDISYTAYPVVTVDLEDDSTLQATVGTPASIEPYNFVYDVASDAVFSPSGYVLNAGTLPAGLSLDPATGAISGTPTETGSFSFTLAATDALGNTVLGSYQLTVAAAVAPEIHTIALSADQLHPGDVLIISGGGFAPGEVVRGGITEGGIDLGSQIADADGNVSFSFSIPQDFALGSYTAVLTGADGAAISDNFSVVDPAVPPAAEDPADPQLEAPKLAQTGAEPVLPVLALSALLGLGGLGLLIRSRRRATA